jgi:hypothetical protein
MTNTSPSNQPGFPPPLDKQQQDVALSIARMSVSLASIVLALLSLTDPPSQGAGTSLQIPDEIRVALSVIGVILILASALTIDFIIDRFGENEWKNALGDGEVKIWRWKFAFNDWDQVPARFSLFNRGYFILCLSLSGIGFAILSQMPLILGTANVILSGSPWILAGYIILQTMTLKTVSFRFAIIAAIFIVIGAILF